MEMAGIWKRLALVVALLCAVAEGQYDEFDFGDMMGDYGDMFDGYGDMFGDMFGGMGYGGYGYGEQAPAHTDLTEMEDVENFKYADPMAPGVIGFLDEGDKSEDVMVLRTTASRMEHMGVRFGLVTEDDLLDELKYKTGRVFVYPAKRFMTEGRDRLKYRYPGESLDAEALQRWIIKTVTPLVGLVTWESGILYQELGLPEVMTFTKVDLEQDGEGFDALMASLRPMASKFEGKMAFNIADKELMQPLAAKCNIPEDAGVTVCVRKEDDFYRMTEDFGEGAVVKFVEAYLAGSLKPEVEPPQMRDFMSDSGEDEDSEDDTHVVVVTPSNFDEVVMAEDKDVMLEFYAPWCGHCKHLRPVYREVASAVADTPSVVVAKMNADALTPPEQFQVTGFPTVVFLKAGDKANPIQYEGARDTDSMVQFIRANASPAPAVEASE